MIHEMVGKFQVYASPTKINCRKVYELIESLGVQSKQVPISQIFYKEVESISVRKYRYRRADISQPCILVTGMKNPQGLKYRMIDGRHRLLKSLNNNLDSIPAFIISFEQIEHFVEAFDEKT